MKNVWKLSDDERKHRQTNGPIYSFIDVVVRTLHMLNPVELKKSGVLKIWPQAEVENIRRVANRTIDTFIVLKWIFLIAIWYFDFTNWFVVSVATVLLVANLHTYFWYHLWVVEHGVVTPGAEFRERRRFVNLLFAISYSVTLYAYLYHRILPTGFAWPKTVTPWLSALIFSVGNSLTGFAGDLRPESTLAQIVVSTQLVMTFIFVAMLLSNSVPRTRS